MIIRYLDPWGLRYHSQYHDHDDYQYQSQYHHLGSHDRYRHQPQKQQRRHHRTIFALRQNILMVAHHGGHFHSYHDPAGFSIGLLLEQEYMRTGVKVWYGQRLAPFRQTRES